MQRFHNLKQKIIIHNEAEKYSNNTQFRFLNFLIFIYLLLFDNKMDFDSQAPRIYHSEHKQLQTTKNSFVKFKPLIKVRHNSIESNLSSYDYSEDKREYNNLSRKLAEKDKMKIGTRHFNKSFYGKLANRIVQKPVSFYKFGLKQEEKITCKAVFKQLFQIDPDKLKGTLSVGELWDNKSMVKYLKQNQMFFNKDILIKQFRSIDKQQKLKKRAIQLQKQRQFVNKYREMVKQNKRLNDKNINYKEMKQMDAKQACSFIRSQISRLASSENKYRIKSNSRKIMNVLQKNYDNFDKIADRFKNKMIVLL